MAFHGTQANQVADPNDVALPLAVPTLFIGVGGTGKQVLMRFRKRLFDAHRRPSLEHSRFLLLDTDMQSLVPSGERPEDYQDSLLRSEDGESIPCGIPPGEFNSVLQAIKFKNDARWAWMHPDMQTYSPNHFSDGAGTIRQAGRLAFFLKYDAIRARIQEHVRQLHNYATNNMGTVDAQKMEFVLVTSLAGGTGSGMFMDLAFLLRDVMTSDSVLNNAIQQRHTTLIAVLPTLFAREDPILGDRFRQNAYAAMLEMEYYNTPRPDDTCFAPVRTENDPQAARTAGAAPVEFNAPWTSKTIRATAWDTCYLIDDINDKLPGKITTSKDLYQMIADYLFLDFESNSFAIAKRSTRCNHVQMRDRILLDEVHDSNQRSIFANRYGCTFSSFGLAEMLIDRDKICRAASYRLAYRIVEHLWQGKKDSLGENAYTSMMKQDLYAKNSPGGGVPGISLHPNSLWGAFLESEAEGHDWYGEVEAEFEQARSEPPDEDSADRLEDLMDKHERRVGPGGEARATMDLRKGYLGGNAVERGVCRQLVAKAARDRFNELGNEPTLHLLTHYWTTFDMAGKLASRFAGQEIDARHDILAQLRDANRVPRHPYSCRSKAIEVVYPSACKYARARVLQRFQSEACGYLEKLANVLRDYVGNSDARDPGLHITTLTYDYSEIRTYLNRLKTQMDARFNLTKRAADTPRKKLFLPEWGGPEYDVVIDRALAGVFVSQVESERFDWKKLEEAALAAIKQAGGAGVRRTRLEVINDWMRIPNDAELVKRVEELADACYHILSGHINLDNEHEKGKGKFKNGFVVDYLLEQDTRGDHMTNLVNYSAPYLPSIGNHEINTAFPPAYVNLLGWVPGDEVRRDQRDVGLHRELNGISITGSDNHLRDTIRAPAATVPTCIALVREMTGVPLNYYSRLPDLKKAYDSPHIQSFQHTCHLDSMNRNLPDIDATRPEEHEQLRNGAETVLRALVLRWIYYEAPDFVVEVRDDENQFGSVKWHLGSRITRIIKHACTNDSIRPFLTRTWTNWRNRATTTQLAVVYLALEQTLGLFPKDGGNNDGNDPRRPTALKNCFQKVWAGIGRELLDNGEEGRVWMNLFKHRDKLNDADYELWKESYDKVSAFITEACLRPASRELPVWQVDQREIGKVTLPGVLELIPNWPAQGS